MCARERGGGRDRGQKGAGGVEKKICAHRLSSLGVERASGERDSERAE